jgi:hypothetical protein
MHSKLYIDTKRNRAFINNDTRFELNHGRDIRQALATLENQRAHYRHVYDALLERMKDTNEVSAKFDAVVDQIRRSDTDISKLYQVYADINSATFADANATKLSIKDHKDAIHALHKRQDPHHIMKKDVKKIVIHTKTINELRNHLKTLETVFFVPAPGRKSKDSDADEEEAPPKPPKKGRKSKDSDEDEEEAPPKPPKKGRKSKDSDADEEEAPPKPPKKGRKSKDSDADEEEAPPKPPKKGRKSKDSDADEEEAPPKPPKKGRKSKDSDADEEEAPPKKVDIDDVKKRVKPKLAALFKFKNVKECLSRAKTMFMSRDDIIAAIESHDDLKKRMPTNFKKLTKEALCEKIETLLATPSPAATTST